ncbi:MAG: hypothetical protein M1813_009701 [Trichoglossum hirsutum]|nr:MAG: hypothetical protein M1813_009701 [Trichoglossum hirsutum]
MKRLHSQVSSDFQSQLNEAVTTLRIGVRSMSSTIEAYGSSAPLWKAPLLVLEEGILKLEQILSGTQEIASRKFYCPVESCNSTFERSDNRRRHIVTTEDILHRQFAAAITGDYCIPCNRVFRRQCDFARHQNKKHGGTILSKYDFLSTPYTSSTANSSGLLSNQYVNPVGSTVPQTLPRSEQFIFDAAPPLMDHPENSLHISTVPHTPMLPDPPPQLQQPIFDAAPPMDPLENSLHISTTSQLPYTPDPLRQSQQPIFDAAPSMDPLENSLHISTISQLPYTPDPLRQSQQPIFDAAPSMDPLENSLHISTISQLPHTPDPLRQSQQPIFDAAPPTTDCLENSLSISTVSQSSHTSMPSGHLLQPLPPYAFNAITYTTLSNPPTRCPSSQVKRSKR